MSDYETDILTWSERQAALLRRVAAGEQINDQVDWPNIIEEVESVGNEQLHAVNSLLRQALLHMLKAEAWPLSLEVPHWQAEARGFRADAADRYARPCASGSTSRGSTASRAGECPRRSMARRHCPCRSYAR
jgi:hypothetical protein